MHNQDEWRIGLRDKELLVPPGGSLRAIDVGVMWVIEQNWEELKSAWDAMYPENPISSVEDGDEGP